MKLNPLAVITLMTTVILKIYVKLIKGRTATLWIDYEPHDDLTIIDGLTGFRRYLDKHEWVNRKKHLDSVFRQLQSELNLSP